MSNNRETPGKREMARTRDLDNFIRLLNEDETFEIDEKKKVLWCEIYKNAVTDRARAGELFDDVKIKIEEDPVNHATLGLQATKYLERAEKATDQLIRLAELLDGEMKAAEHIDPENVYAKISDGDD